MKKMSSRLIKFVHALIIILYLHELEYNVNVRIVASGCRKCVFRYYESFSTDLSESIGSNLPNDGPAIFAAKGHI